MITQYACETTGGERVEDHPIDIQELIRRLNTGEHLHGSSHFSDSVSRGEPIIKTGRQLMRDRERAARRQQNHPDAPQPAPRPVSVFDQLDLDASVRTRRLDTSFPNRYREMCAISRWEQGAGRGRWLTEAELFYKQAHFMADFEDTCPYEGSFRSYCPTYNEMSNRQLRGYFTWRAAVRRGDVQEAPTAFAFVYLYELLCGVGIETPRDGFEKIRSFWLAYRDLSPEFNRTVRPWLKDYAVYHGLDPALIELDDPSITFDRNILELVELCAPYDADAARALGISESEGARPTAPANLDTAPLPPDKAWEERLFEMLDRLSAHRLCDTPLEQANHDDLRHVTCAVFVRMLAYYRGHRTKGLIESAFGEMATMSYTMFGSAVFFDPQTHEDTEYELDPIHRFTCRRGLWTCTRIYGGRGRSSKLGDILHAVDRLLRTALACETPLEDEGAPKYLARIIEREISSWLAWKRDHAPRVIDIDLSQLSGIRSAAAETREALLIDEEREDEPSPPTEAAACPRAQTVLGRAPLACGTARGDMPQPAGTADHSESRDRACDAGTANPSAEPASSMAAISEPSEQTENMLTADERAYLVALLTGETAPVPAGTSEDMLIDGINEKLFDAIGDTVIEFGIAGPELIEDYRDDLREVLGI